MNQRSSIIIADDHPILRGGLRQIIEREDSLEVLAECGDGESVLNETLSRQPELVILDIDMPRGTGLEVLKALRESDFPGKVIVMTVYSEEEFFDEAIRLGANGYILKDSASEDIVTAIRAVLDGQNYVSPSLTKYLFRQKRKPEPTPSGLDALTPTELRILQLIAEYKTNKQIAELLFISALTVKTHRRNISIKLNLEGNHALMRFAIENQDRLLA